MTEMKQELEAIGIDPSLLPFSEFNEHTDFIPIFRNILCVFSSEDRVEEELDFLLRIKGVDMDMHMRTKLCIVIRKALVFINKVFSYM